MFFFFLKVFSQLFNFCLVHSFTFDFVLRFRHPECLSGHKMAEKSHFYQALFIKNDLHWGFLDFEAVWKLFAPFCF